MENNLNINKLALQYIKMDISLPDSVLAQKMMDEVPEIAKRYKNRLESLRKRLVSVRKSNNITMSSSFKEKTKITNDVIDTKNILVDSIVESGDTKQITQKSNKQIHTLEGLIKECKIDINEWEIERWLCNKWEVGFKTKKMKDGKVIDVGFDTNPLFQVKVWLRRNKPKQTLISTKNEIIAEIKKYKPTFPKITYDKSEKLLYEICPFDIHFGKLTWGEETNFDYDIKIAEQAVLSCVQEHIDNAKRYKVERILFPVGNDFFNSDNKQNTTSSGTPQDEDTRWKKTYKRGRQLMIKCIDMLSTVAPVDILVIPGNHDVERAFYLGDSLECWYNASKNIKIDNSPKNRKYYDYGKCLIGYAHGKDEKINDLPTLMAIEVPDLFAKAKHREWHLGDKHHEKKIQTISVDEKNGVTVRILSSPSPADLWHYNKGYIGSRRAMQGFLWDKENGQKAQFIAHTK